MSLEPMEAFFRDCVRIEAQAPERMQASLTFPPDLQGPPEAGHGGGIVTMLFEMVGLFRREVGGEPYWSTSARIASVLHRELPLDVPLTGEVVAEEGGWHSYILREERLIAEAEVRAVTEPPPPVPAAVRQAWEAMSGEADEVPAYEFCLACGVRNARGAQVRFDYNDRFVWKRLVPQSHFRCADGSLFPGFLCIVGDEIGWWLGALRQGECGVTNRVTMWLGRPITHGVALLVLGDRSDVAAADAKGRMCRTRAWIVAPDWNPVAAIEVQFAGSPAFTKTMLPAFLPCTEPAAVWRVFPRYGG